MNSQNLNLAVNETIASLSHVSGESLAEGIFSRTKSGGNPQKSSKGERTKHDVEQTIQDILPRKLDFYADRISWIKTQGQSGNMNFHVDNLFL